MRQVRGRSISWNFTVINIFQYHNILVTLEMNGGSVYRVDLHYIFPFNLAISCMRLAVSLSVAGIYIPIEIVPNLQQHECGRGAVQQRALRTHRPRQSVK